MLSRLCNPPACRAYRLETPSHSCYNIIKAIRRLAKVHKFKAATRIQYHRSMKPKWRNGRRAGLKIRWGNTRVGSSPTFGTIDLRRFLGRRSGIVSLLSPHFFSDPCPPIGLDPGDPPRLPPGRVEPFFAPIPPGRSTVLGIPATSSPSKPQPSLRSASGFTVLGVRPDWILSKTPSEMAISSSCR